MSVKINITDQTVQVTKRATDGSVTDELNYEPPDGLPATGSKGQLMVHNGVEWLQLGAGTNGYVLSSNPAASLGVEWVSGGSGSGMSVYDVTDYGAVGDGTTDDASAIQAAIAAAIAAGGGRVYFPKTTASWRIKTEIVSISTGSKYPNVTLCGEAGAGPIRVAGAARINGFRFDNFGTLDFEHLTFVEEAGDPGLTAALWYAGANNLRSTVRNCQFLGLSSNGSILTGLGLFQQCQDLHFGGCSAPSGFVVALLTSTSYVADCSFIDYGNHRGTYYSKTPSGVQAWIGGSGDWSLAQFDSVGNAPIVVERCHFDEGAAAAVQIYNSGYLTNYAPSLLVSDCTHLLATPAGWYSIVAQGVMNVRVERHAMKAQNNTGGAFNISYCQRFEADACWARGTAGAYYPPSSLGAYFVHIQDCEGIDTAMTLTASVFLATWEQYCLRGTYYTAEWTGGVANQAYPVKMGAADLGVTYMRMADTSDMAIGCVIETTTSTKPVKVCTHGELRMKNDTFGSLVRGDKVGASPSEDGAVRKVTTGAYYGIVLAACAPSGIVRMRWMPGRF